MEKSQHGGVVNLNEIKGIEVSETVELQVTGKLENGSIEKIEAIETEGIEFIEDDKRNSSESKIYVVTDNGTYHFRITGSTGRSYLTQITVNNAAVSRKDLLTGIADVNGAGYKMIKVNGKTTEVDKTKEIEESAIYTVDVVYCDSDLILKNGSYTLNASGSQVSKTVDGLSYNSTNNTWSVGKASDVNTNIVVLKVNGNLTLESSYKLTSVKANTTDVAKGLFIYCTGTLTINGTIDMSYVTCTATGQNVYLWKNQDDSFEYIRKNGGNGGAAGKVGQSYGYSFTMQADNGTTQTLNDTHWITGGGGSGAHGSKQKAGLNGTSWCGGKGSSVYDEATSPLASGGGIIVCYGNIVRGSGSVLTNGQDAVEGNGHGTYASISGGGGGGVALVFMNDTEKASLKLSANGGARKNPWNYWGETGGSGFCTNVVVLTGNAIDVGK